MPIQIIHFSDIHFQSKEDALFEKENELFNAFKNEISEDCILIISGDSSFSGQEAEFELAIDFINSLKSRIEDYSNINITPLIIPGNHDCQNLAEEDVVRETLLEKLQNKSNIARYELIEEVSKNLDNYYSYEDLMNSNLELVSQNKLLKKYRHYLDGKKIIFYCYNTAFQSVLHEISGKMVMPIDLLEDVDFEEPADLRISCFHHPLHWLNPDNSRLFRKHIEKTSDIFFTGHEHIDEKSLKDNLNGNFTYHIEGDVLQDTDSKSNSGFNLINLDLDAKSLNIKNFKFNGSKYKENDDNTKKYPFKQETIRVNSNFQLTQEFKDELDDVGANFSHPNISKINLSDIYIYPNLEVFTNADDPEENSVVTINSEKLLNQFDHEYRIIITGPENIGKTSLLKKYYRRFYRNGKLPVLIEGFNIKSTALKDFENVLFKAFSSQYLFEDREDFNQIDRKNLVILIDDFNRVKINIKYRARLLQNLINSYQNILITGNELMSLEDIITDEQTEADLYSSFEVFEIKEFGYELRSDLINKWNTLGVEHTISEEERIRKLQYCENVINTVTGVNFVPPYPFFLLTILQSIEAGNPTDLSASTFGYYYQFLIQKSFKKVLQSQREITEYENYLSELCYYLYLDELLEFDLSDIQKFDKYYRSVFTISHSMQKILNNLQNAKIIENLNGNIEIKYSYIRYYFLSKYFSNNIGKKEIKKEIEKLIKSLHRSENSNVLMFLTHHTNNEFLLKKLLLKTKNLFSQLEPCKLENDITNINELGGKIPEMIFENRSVDDYRRSENRLKDQGNSGIDKLEEDSDEPIFENEIEIVANLNTAFKAMEIIGQILKNNYGKIEKTNIEILLEETILLGLRTLNVFFRVIEENSEFVVNQVNSIISEIEATRGKKIDNPKKIESLSKSTLFGLCNQMSYGFIKKISDCIGTEYLDELLEKVYSRQDYNSVKLVRLAIKLDHYRSFPNADIKKYKKEFSNSYLALSVMKRLVVHHLYLYPTNYKQKSQILDYLGIPVTSQIKIDQTSKQKK